MKLHLKRPQYPFFRMEVEEDLILCLIQKQLNIHWFLSDLENVGFDPSGWPISLESAIFALVGIRPDDDAYNWFLDMLTDQVNKLEESKTEYSTSEASITIFQALKGRRQQQDKEKATKLASLSYDK
ncbi:hypothetical protein LVD15_03705 [Fulvivirga maritima]|uniref:hypothetical protein n=1 Tax=Fulvivirga maritima TaxID=2904247 RepID=UPI001F253C65|nr:hypothetical protein [Fulvivirga maritima]UII27549.1 hypothetical protein LVD15_03705 [Fulvivirga maritima]